MIGLRKVVKLKIFDIPKGMTKLNGDNNNYQFYWRNRYYLGNVEVYRSTTYNNIVKKPFFNDKCDDDYLGKIIESVVSKDEDIDSNIYSDDDMLFYGNGRSTIYYSGDNVDKIKRKIYKK